MHGHASDYRDRHGAGVLIPQSGRRLRGGVRTRLDHGTIAPDIEAGAPLPREAYPVRPWPLDGARSPVAVRARLRGGLDAFGTAAAIKRLLASRHGMGHATVEPECGARADMAGGHRH